MKENTEPFEELFIPRKELQSSSAMLYRVYSDYKNFELVEAASALDALAISKKRNVYKIQRHDPLGYNVIHLNQVMQQMFPESDIPGNNVPESFEHIEKQQEKVQEPVAAAPATAPEPAAPVAAAAPEPVASSAPAVTDSAPLSNEEIDKLLNG